MEILPGRIDYIVAVDRVSDSLNGVLSGQPNSLSQCITFSHVFPTAPNETYTSVCDLVIIDDGDLYYGKRQREK